MGKFSHHQLCRPTQLPSLHDRSNNPFAPTSTPSPSISTPTQPRPPAFNLGGTYDNNHSTSHLSSLASSSPVPSQTNPYANQQNQQQQAQVRTKKDLAPNEQRLADLFANRDDGTDTFGNIGNLRCDILFLVLLVKLNSGFYQVWANGSWPFGCSAKDRRDPPQSVRNATAVDEQRASVLRYLAWSLNILLSNVPHDYYVPFSCLMPLLLLPTLLQPLFLYITLPVATKLFISRLFSLPLPTPSLVIPASCLSAYRRSGSCPEFGN